MLSQISTKTTTITTGICSEGYDGTWFPNKMCLVIYRDETVRTTLLYRLTVVEWEEEKREDLENLQLIGIEIESVTSDGGNNIIKVVKILYMQMDLV